MKFAMEAELLRIYAVLCLVKGSQVTNEDVHDAWSAWKSGFGEEHKSLKPFDELDQRTQDLDTEYRDAIRAASTQIARARADEAFG